jgi:hypothetical protein
LAIWISPWLWQKRIMVATGNASICVGRAAPDAAHHRQEIPVAEGGAEAVDVQELAERLGQFAFRAGLGDARGQAVEAQEVGQHAEKARVGEVAPLGEHGGEVVAAPFEGTAVVAGGLDRERHLRQRRLDAEVGEQADQVRIGAVVVDQEAGVHAVGDRGGIARRARQRRSLPCARDRRSSHWLRRG